jgi:hypothetical protein
MHLGQAGGPANVPSHFRAELAGYALEDPAFALRGSSTLRNSEWSDGLCLDILFPVRGRDRSSTKTDPLVLQTDARHYASDGSLLF